MPLKTIEKILTPDVKKIALTVAVYLLIIYFAMASMNCSAVTGISCRDIRGVSFFFTPLLLVFYPIFCFLIYVWDKINEKK